MCIKLSRWVLKQLLCYYFHLVLQFVDFSKNYTLLEKKQIHFFKQNISFSLGVLMVDVFVAGMYAFSFSFGFGRSF